MIHIALPLTKLKILDNYTRNDEIITIFKIFLKYYIYPDFERFVSETVKTHIQYDYLSLEKIIPRYIKLADAIIHLPYEIYQMKNNNNSSFYSKNARDIHFLDPLNIGIEIEGCKQNDNDLTLSYFRETTDISIQCKDNKIQVEYILNEYIKSDNLNILSNDISKIFGAIIGDDGNACYKYCGMHFHISSDEIRFDLYGLLFLVNLIQIWIIDEQEIFLLEYPYQLTLYGDSYTNPNDIAQSSILSSIKLDIIEKIKGDFDSDSKFITLVDIFNRIRLNNHKRHYLNIYHIFILNLEV